MPNWKTKLIEAYRLTTAPYRFLQFAKMSRTGQVPVFVLFYHRVADDYPNPWTISRSQFKEQIEWFQERFDIVDLEECQRRIVSGHNQSPTLAITFDDGYADNCEFALPMLIERRIPVTYFVTTYHTSMQRPFPHDVERGVPLATNTIDSLKSLDLAGIEIGAHTRTHADLGDIDCVEQLMDEVIISSRELQGMIGREIRYFAFPFGQYEHLNSDVFAMLKAEGFKGACSAYGGWNDIGGDAFHLQRLHGDPNMARIMNWLSYDPRIAKRQRYDYSDGQFDSSLLDVSLQDAPAMLRLPIAETDATNNPSLGTTQTN